MNLLLIFNNNNNNNNNTSVVIPFYGDDNVDTISNFIKSIYIRACIVFSSELFIRNLESWRAMQKQ